MQEHTWVQACSTPRMPKMQEGSSLEWRLWHGLICVLGPAKEDLSLDTIWDRFEEFCKPQVNEVRAHFDLLRSFWQGTRSVDEWYNAVQVQINLARYPPETAKILHRDIFCFFLKDEDFVSKTINEGSVDLDRFPASRV